MPNPPPALQIKRVYAPPSAADGIRVLVDRLWPRGLRKESARLALWMKDIAPTPALRTWFDHDPARFEEFARRYQAELAANPVSVARLQEQWAQGPVTLLYAARDEHCNHALVLADYLRQHADG